MTLRLPFFLLPILTLIYSRPLYIERNGTTYSLNAGLCEEWSCGSDEGRGSCTNHIYSGLPAHYCTCNLPFTGAFCDDTIRLNASLPGSRYADCPFPTYCASVYGNGECNQECNTVDCLYDGYECQVSLTCAKEEYCRDRFSNGICDEECMSEECEFDGDDCFSAQDTLPGQLFLRLTLTTDKFMRLSHLILFQLSRFLRATVVLGQDDLGPLMWAWSAEEGRGARIIKGAQNPWTSIEVAFSIDVRRCSAECLDTIERVARFIDQALANQSSPMSAALIQSVSFSSPSPPPPPTSSPSPLLSSLLGLAAGFCVVSLIIGTLYLQKRQRKRVLEAPVWYPPQLGGTTAKVLPVKRARLAPPATSTLHRQAAGTQPIEITTADDVNGRDEQGRTPLLLTIRSDRREAELRETVTLLVNYGADTTAVDEDGWGALHHALHHYRSPNMNRFLISLGASPLVVDTRGRTLVHLATEYSDEHNLRMILETGALKLIDAADYSNRLALSTAIADCPIEIARLLLDAGANTNSNGDKQFDASATQRFPLHTAVQYGKQEHVRLLVDRHCRLDVRDNRQRTALHYAVQFADLAMCQMLVDAGAQVDAMDDEDRTAEEMAADWKLEDMRAYLVSVRGHNEPRRRRRLLKKPRYLQNESSDQGYGSEETSQQVEIAGGFCDNIRSSSPPLPPLTMTPQHRSSFGIPKWGTMAQLPMFLGAGPLVTPLTAMTMPAPLQTPGIFPSVLTPSHSLLVSSSISLNDLPPPPLPLRSSPLPPLYIPPSLCQTP